MKNNRLIIDSWLDIDQGNPLIAYLDAGEWELFAEWVRKDLEFRSRKLIEREWHVVVFRSQLIRCFGTNTKRDKLLKALGVDLDTKTVENDERFIVEVLRAYFHNDPSMRPQAELLASARKNEINKKVWVISQHKAFWRIPDVDTFFIDEKRLKGFDDLPAGFDFFTDMKIHRKIHQAASERINNGDNPTAIIESVKTLFEEVRKAAGLDDDGYDLMRDAFGCQKWQKNLPVLPFIKLSKLSSETEWNEQKGFRDIACGIASALRNPIAHEPADEAFIQARYGDKRASLKILCILSLLLEKVDKRVEQLENIN